MVCTLIHFQMISLLFHGIVRHSENFPSPFFVCVCTSSWEHVHSCMYVFVYRLEVNIKGLPQSILSIWDSVFHWNCSSARLAELASPRNPPSLSQVCITIPFLWMLGVSSCLHGKHPPSHLPGLCSISLTALYGQKINLNEHCLPIEKTKKRGKSLIERPSWNYSF